MTAGAARVLPRLGAVAAAAALLAGCGDKGSGTTATVDRTVTSRVQVLKEIPTGDGTTSSSRFDPQRIYARDAPGVVTVVSTGLKGAGGRNTAGVGSGFVISGGGEIATNAHVVTSGEGAQITKARTVYVRFPDGNQVDASVVGFDPFNDIALLRVDPADLTLRPLPLGSSDDLRIGAPVAAIGSPFGEEQSLSVGVISALNRSIDSLTAFSTTGAIQTDAAINHGNSGGPLLDAAGRVLGINSQIKSDSGEGSGVGFAIPVDVVKRSLAQLRENGKATYAYLGLSTRALYPQVAREFRLPVEKGVWVQDVTPGGPAAEAGLRAAGPRKVFQQQQWLTGGDVIVGIGGAKVTEDDDLAQALLRKSPGQTVTVHVYRDGKPVDVKVTLKARPLSARG